MATPETGERSMADRIEMLLRKNKFTAAICLLSDASQIAELRRRYGDHFYAKEDYDGALTQYAQTVGWIEPSYVIRQFLQVAQIRNLASYLEGLHKASLATAEHTTLLLSCYSQLKVSSSKVYDAFQTMLGSDTKQNRDISDILLRKCCDARTSSQEEAASVERGNCESRQIKQLKDCGDAALRTLVSNVTAITKLDDQAKSLTSPIVVLRTVAQTGDGNFSSVRDYVARALAEDSCALRRNCNIVSRLKKDISKSRTQLMELQRTSHIFQSNRCSTCSQTLDLPAVHFLCLHSFHEACIPGEWVGVF